MKTHPVKLETDVFEYLQDQARPLESVSDVLRRLLKPSKPRPRKVNEPPSHIVRRPGALTPLLEAGVLEADDDLVTQICAGLVARHARIPWEEPGDLPVERMAREAPDTPQTVPLHPAAERFWRSRGYL